MAGLTAQTAPRRSLRSSHGASFTTAPRSFAVRPSSVRMLIFASGLKPRCSVAWRRISSKLRRSDGLRLTPSYSRPT
eukprot:4714997-Pleurochrysis_carterae.AAC.1